MHLTELWIFQVLQKCRGTINVKLLYNNCLTHYFSEFEWTPGMSEKLILGFQNRVWFSQKQVRYFKNLACVASGIVWVRD